MNLYTEQQYPDVSPKYIPDDGQLAQLHIVLCCERMQRVFTEYFRAFSATAHFRIAECKILRIRYKPALYCRVTYRLKVQDAATKRCGTQLICIRVFRPGASHSRFRKAQILPQAQPSFGSPLIHMPELSLVGWAFPNDRKLSGIRYLTDDDYLREAILPSLVRRTLGRGWQLGRIDRHLVQYFGEQGCAWTIRVSTSRGDEVRSLRFFAKTYAYDNGPGTFRTMHDLWQLGTVNMPEPLTYDADSRSLWQQVVDGSPLTSGMLESGQHVVAQVAALVASLHQADLRGTRVVSLDDLLDDLDGATTRLSSIHPLCSEALEQLSDRLKATAPDMAMTPFATLHGDLHLKNFLASPSRIYLVDFDSLCRGPALLDLGSLFSRMLYQCAKGTLSSQTAEAINRQFLQAYSQEMGWPVCRNTLHWFIALTLITERASRCVSRLEADRLDIVDKLILLAGQVIDTTQSVSPGIATDASRT